MEIGDWKATRGLNEAYRAIREQGLETHLAELDAFGFTVIEDAAPPALVERLRDAVLRVTADRVGARDDGLPALDGMAYQNHLLVRDRAFEEALLLEEPLALVKYLVGDSCIFSTMGSHVRGPGGTELGLHADVSGWVPEPFPVYPLFANCTLALTDYTREEGALAVVPGSHRKCRSPEPRESPVEGNDRAVAVEVPAGSAILWHGNLWHGGYARSAPGFRVNLAMVFLRPGLVPQEDYRGLISDEAFERNGEAFARLLGRDVPWNFGEDGPDYAKMAKQGAASKAWHR